MMGTPKGGRRDPALFRHADLRKALLQALSCRSAPCWRSSTRRCRKWHTASISQCLRSPKERRWKHSSENCTVTELRAEGGRRGRPLGHPNACGNSTYLRVRMGICSRPAARRTGRCLQMEQLLSNKQIAPHENIFRAIYNTSSVHIQEGIH